MTEKNNDKCPECGTFLKKIDLLCPECGARPMELPKEEEHKDIYCENTITSQKTDLDKQQKILK